MIFIWSGRTIFFLDIADAFFFAQAKFHKSNTMLSQEQEKKVSAESYCKKLLEKNAEFIRLSEYIR